uniref:U4-Liphistoxin-Lth1a_1 n=1 Tax=Liphistius thaleban TaxID=1905330 RepID=A0A4V2H900_9ARAC
MGLHKNCSTTKFVLVAMIFLVIVAAAAKRDSLTRCSKTCGDKVCQTVMVKCSAITEEQCPKPNIIKNRGSGEACGCCPNCIKEKPKEEGECCSVDTGYGVPNPVEDCNVGLKCDCKKKVCVKCEEC